jgi:hypothetical protein
MAQVGVPVYFTEAAWKLCIMGRDEDDFPGRCHWVLMEILEARALAVRLGVVA